MINRVTSFQDQMRMSEGVNDKKDIKKILLEHFPNAVDVERANIAEDKNGTDYWVTMRSGQKNSVDVKVRKEDWAKRHPDEDDIALEIWSKLQSKIGWTRNTTKRTDYILWIWLETGRNMLIPFPMLCSVFEKHWEEWSKTYKAPIQTTKNANGSFWKSQCVFVPRRVVWNSIYIAFSGIPEPAPQRQVNPNVTHTQGIEKARNTQYGRHSIEREQ